MGKLLPMMVDATTERPTQELPMLISAQRMCELLGVSQSTFRRLIRRGEFPYPLRVGGASRWAAHDYNAYIARLRAKQQQRHSRDA